MSVLLPVCSAVVAVAAATIVWNVREMRQVTAVTMQMKERIITANNAADVVAAVREYVETSDDDGVRTREEILRITGPSKGEDR